MVYEHESASEHSAHAGGMLAGLLCGLAFGAAIGLLFAPRPGADMRRQVADSTRQVRRRATDATAAVRDVVDRSRRAYAAGRDAYRDAKASQGSVRSPGVSVS